MSSFKCEHCGIDCIDTDHGYITGCKHYPADLPRLTTEQCDEIFSDMNDSNRYELLRATFAVGYMSGNNPASDKQEQHVYTDNSKVNTNLLAENAQLKMREAIAVKALEDLNKHYNTILRDAPCPSAAWHIVRTALSELSHD